MGLDPIIIDGKAIDPLALIFSGPVLQNYNKKISTSTKRKGDCHNFSAIISSGKESALTNVKTYTTYLKAVNEAIGG